MTRPADPALAPASAGEPHPDWIPGTVEVADAVVERWTQRKIQALLRERGLDDEVETTRRFVIETIPEYADRFLLELLQNAHDALPEEGHGRIRVELDLNAPPHGELLVANTGTPFRYRDFRALCRMAQSEKRPGEGIGHKGVGFKSVLQVAPHPEIYSGASSAAMDAFHGFRFTFPDEARYRELFADAGEDVPKMTPYSLPVVLPVEQQSASVRRLAAAGYATVVRLPLAPLAGPAALRATQDILSSSAPVLLFLHRIGELVVSIEPGTSGEFRLTRTPTPIATGQLARVEEIDLAEAGRFLVTTGSADEAMFKKAIREDVEARRVSERWLEWTGQPEVSVAIPLEPRTDDRLYCYLPMQDSAHSPVAGHVNGPFAIGLARKELISDSHINEVLLEATADVSVDAAIELRAHAAFRSTVVDLVAWPRGGVRVVEALRRRGEDPSRIAILPVLGNRDWAPFEEAWCWAPEGTTQLTPATVARLVDDPLVDPAIGRERLAAIAGFGQANLDLPMEPPPEQIAGWTEAVALQLHGRERAGKPPAAAWMDLYDDLPIAFPGTTGRALAGRRVLIGEEKELLETWSDAGTPQPRRRIRREVFFAPTALEDPDVDATDEGGVPVSLRRVLARVHPELNWFVPGEAGRRNRPGRVFLEQQDLVRVPRILDVLRLVERVLRKSRSARVWRDALVFVYRLTRPGPRRPDLRTLGLEGLGLRVPAGGTWIPIQRALFSRGWTDRGALLSDLVGSASSVSTELTGLRERLLDPPGSWIPKRTQLDGWLELLKYCGVGDGLRPVALNVSVSSSSGYGWWWRDKKRVADGYGINDADRVSWLEALEFGNWPRSSGAYVALGSPCRIPGQSDFDQFPEKAKSAFARLVLADLADWEDGALSFVVDRRGRASDPQRIPSPLRTFLASARWLRVRRPGGGGEDDWVAPSEAWLIQATEHEPFFAPVLDRRFRSDIERSERAQRRLVELGAHFWSERGHAVAKLLLLGRLLHDELVLPGLIAQVRNAVEETWRTIVEAGPPLQLGDLKEAFLVVARSEHLDTISGSSSESYFVLGSADKTLELLLVSIGKPVLVANGDVGQKVWTHLQASGASAARLILPSDLVVEVDGRSASELIDSAPPLVSGDRRWLSDLVALTLELKPTAFHPRSADVVQRALQRLLEIRVIAGSDVALMLDGQRLEVPAHAHRVVPTDVDGIPAIVWAPDDETLTWRGLLSLAPAIAELVLEHGVRDALENVVHRLGEGGRLAEQPTDDHFARVFGVSVVRIVELRQSHRGVVSQVLYHLVPLVACLLGPEAAIEMRNRATEASDLGLGLQAALEMLRGRLPSHITIESLREAARRGNLREAREELGIDFGEMNRSLSQLGPPYVPEVHPDLHATVMSAFLATCRDVIVDALRVRAIADGIETTGTLDRYGEDVAALDKATKEARMPDVADLLAPDPTWLQDHLEPPDDLLADRVTRWLALHGAPPLGGSSSLASASSLRAANCQLLFKLLPRAALVISAWVDQHGVSAAPGWTGNPGALVQQLAVSGQLDFALLDEGEVIALLVAREAWPLEMAQTLDLVPLHLTEADLLARRDEEEQRRAVDERAKRGVDVAGRVITLDPATVGASVAYVLATIDATSLEVPPSEVTLGSAPPSGGKGKGNNGGGGKAGGGGTGRVPKEKLETIGLIGEIVAWAWLCHHYGESNVLWRSENRVFKFQDGDPGDDRRGFDFEVLRGRSRLYYEVKASTSDPREFELSEAEVRFALSKAHTATYRVLYIGNVNAPAGRVILPLPNPLAARSRDHYRPSESGIKYAFAARDEPRLSRPSADVVQEDPQEQVAVEAE